MSPAETSRLLHINAGNLPGADVLVNASVRERLEALRVLSETQGLQTEGILMAMGAISLLSSFGRATIPERLGDTLSWASMELTALRRAGSDEGELP